MATAKEKSKQRRIIQEKIKDISQLSLVSPPRSGWVKAIRGALGISTRALAKLLKIDMASIVRLEEREIKGTVTLATLDSAARAMRCRLVYAIVPEPDYASLDAIIDAKALALARKMVSEVGHSMKLESQGVLPAHSEEQIKQLAEELKQKMDPQIWENP